MAEAHFSCPYVTGVPLEDEGGPGAAGSHWESIAMGNDIQVARSPTNAKLSKFTLQLLDESGHYLVNWDMEEAFTYGHGSGCGLLNGQCSSASGVYCTKRGLDGCFLILRLGVIAKKLLYPTVVSS